MGIEDLGLLLENIEEYVMEQKKVVTYKWLSRTFSLNVNQAKQLLAIFHMKHKNMKHKSIRGVYYVSGMRSNSDGFLTHQICIVSEELLEATKAQLDPVTSVHLYSVQKGKPKDTASIYNVDFEQLKKKVYETTEFSMIRCKEAKISQVINNSLRPVTPPALKNKVKVIAPAGKPDKMDSKKSVTLKKTNIVKKPAETTKKFVDLSKKTSGNKKQENLSNFFGKGKSDSRTLKAETKKPEPKATIITEKISRDQPKPTIITETKVIKIPKKPKKPDEERKPKKPDEERKPKKPDEETRRVSPRKASKAQQPLCVEDVVLEREVEECTKARSNGKTSKTGTKRKRVMQFSDEEEEEEVKEEVKDEGICLEEEEPQIGQTELSESPECKKPKVRRKRVKKLITRTRINEDGFMETEKVSEMVSCTDEDEEKAEVKEVETKKKTSPLPMEVEEGTSKPPPRNKQSNLMGFFKKG